MIHPLLHLVATKPHLLSDHVHAYSELISAEVGKTTKRWVSTAVLYGAAAFLLLLGLIFSGIALMLLAIVPPDDMYAPWLLIAVPLVPLAAGVFCFFKAKADPKETAFQTIKEQLKTDAAMLREVGAAA
jgi:uncharacterized membrane protein YqjE